MLFLGQCINLSGQENTHDLTVKLSISEDLKASFKSEGRLFLFLNKSERREPRTQTWPNPGNYIFAKNLSDFKADQILELKHGADWSKTTDWTLNEIPEGDYYIQILWDQDTEESGINAPGNIYAQKQKVELNKSSSLDIELTEVIGPRKIDRHELVREIHFKSDTLSKWWGKPVYLKASVLLPRLYKEGENKAYPVRYNVSGYGGRYTKINRLVRSRFMNWWQSKAAPQILNVFLDGEGPFGDSYQMDSENSGPYGYAVINELIPHIEKQYRGTDTAETRFVDGCSTGGWVSLGLQLYYPDFFNGVFSYSPDAIDFEHYQLINIYEDENAYVNEHNYLRPVQRDVNGEPALSLQDFIQYENVLGASNTYLNSGGQFSAHTALYSPKGEDGLPQPLFDPVTGDIDQTVAEHWKKYDFKYYAKENWEELGPKLEGKIFIWMGDMDNFYLNPATRSFDKFLKKTTNPISDAEVVFSPMEGHCWQFSHKEVLKKIQEKVESLEQKK
jgi:enterochelin esterase-like enzyme